jgi:thermitase
MRRAVTATLGVAAFFAVTSTAGADDSVIVKYAGGAASKARSAAADRAGVSEVLGSVIANGAQVVRVRGDAAAAAATLNRSSTVEYAEPNLEMHTLATPNDPLFGQLYALNNANDADIDAPEGWGLQASLSTWPASGGVTVGVVDTGIDANHEDLVGKTAACGSASLFTGAVSSGGCADQNDHGTHVSGTIAAIANNGKGVAGVAFDSRIAMCRALDARGSGTTAAVANCITWLANQGVKVISMSLGGGSATTLQNAVSNASKTSLIIAAAGNDGDGTLNYPAAYPEVVSVAATDSSDAHASFSNVNSDVEISAAGVDVLSTKRGGGYVKFSGTSMATPHVAGVAAEIASQNPSWGPAQIRAKLDAAVDDLGAPGRDSTFGFGRVNLEKALS